ncbi:hypothetical protein Tco_1255613 [Tanacetum coccineum]
MRPQTRSHPCLVTFNPFDNYMPITERQLESKGSSTTLEVKNYVKEDHALIKKVLDAAEALPRYSQPSLSSFNVDPKALQSAKGGQDFLKKQDAEIKVLNRERLEKLTKAKELRKKRIDQFKWTTSSRFKPEKITDIHIHPNTKQVAITLQGKR